MFALTLAEAIALDAQDDLAAFRQAFVIDDPELIYLDGNSLGRLPRATAALLSDMVTRQWGQRLIRSWNEGWFTLSQRIGGKLARLVGAQPDEVILADSTSVNLYKLTAAALQARPGRRKIVSDDLNFPSDLYIFQGALNHTGWLQIVPSPDGIHGPPTAALADALNENAALLSLSHTAFKSGYTYDMAAITEIAHAAGALTLWDLSHSVGAVPIDLNGSGVDLAVGCTYKYLNGGPGAPAFLYVRRDLQEQLRQPISGWFGQRNQFALGLHYEAGAGITRFLTGTPPLLSLAAVEPGVDLLVDAGISRLRAKSIQQTEYLIALWQAWLQPLGFSLNSPRDAAQRGSHVSLGHPEAARIDRTLIEQMNVLPDFRRPDNLRLGIASLYTSFQDIYTAMTRLHHVVAEQLYEQYSPEMPDVT